MYKTAQQLIREAHEVANDLPPASSALLTELASRLDVSIAATSQACDERSAAINTITAIRVNSGCPEGVDVQDWVKQLAAENVTMLRLLTDISENHVEYFSEGEDGMFAGVPLDYVSEINMYVSRDVNAENPFPATDSIYAGIKAAAAAPLVSALTVIANSEQISGETVVCDFDTLISVAACALRDYYAQQLREVSANG
ncbi:hypothetical protein [Klebsiella michiganensis]|uniref:hypothetical protein n=1 Tax=Klebsiella michiganensis TaxID=1134687 RepID=UPI0037678A82